MPDPKPTPKPAAKPTPKPAAKPHVPADDHPDLKPDPKPTVAPAVETPEKNDDADHADADDDADGGAHKPRANDKDQTVRVDTPKDGRPRQTVQYDT